MLKVALALMALLLLAVPAGAQEVPPWTAYLYNSNLNQMIAVQADGTQTMVDIGLPPGSYIGQADLPFTADGARTAFCAVTPNEAGQSSTRIVVRDLVITSDALSVDLGPVQGCYIGGFSELGDRIAVGVVRGYPGDPNLQPGQPLWEVLVYDVASGQTVSALTPDNPMLGTVDPQGIGTYLPLIRDYVLGRVIFALAPWATEGSGFLPAFEWDVDQGTVTPVEGWGNLGVDRSPTGELIYLDLDENRASGSPMGPMPTYNVVRYDDLSGTVRTIFHSPDWLPIDARFVNAGQQVLITMFESYNPDAPDAMPRTRLVLLGRDGTQTEVGMYASYVDTVDAPGGFGILHAEDTGGMSPPPIHFDYYAGGTPTRLWSIVSDNMGISWSIAGATPTIGLSDSTPFPEV